MASRAPARLTVFKLFATAYKNYRHPAWIRKAQICVFANFEFFYTAQIISVSEAEQDIQKVWMTRGEGNFRKGLDRIVSEVELSKKVRNDILCHQ